jgi:hypothetical protein
VVLSWLARVSWGGFVDQTPPELALDGVKEGGAVFFDLDQDGDLDLLLAGEVGVAGARLLRADAPLAWTDVTESQAPALLGYLDATRGLFPADFTNDGYPDLLRVGRWEVDLLESSGPPAFALEPVWSAPYPLTTQGFEGSGVFDADGDGFLDALVTGGGVANWLLVNPGDGTARWALVDQGPLGLTAYSNSDGATLGDWDFDGDVDVVIRGQGDGPDAFLNQGGSWSADPGVDLDGADAYKGAVSLCDPRGLGVLDLYWSSPLDPVVTGFAWSGTWTPLPIASSFWPTGAESVSCVDIDDDGFSDLWLSDDDDEDVFHGPSFTYEAVANAYDDTIASAFADVDGDGDQDVLLTNVDGPDRLLVNAIDDGRTLLVAIRADVGTCDRPVYRDDFGAWARIVAPIPGSLTELSGGAGRGQLATPWLHFGLDPAEVHRLEVAPRFGGSAPFELEVPRDTRELVIATDDPDGDGIPTEVEVAVGGEGDADGDGLLDWADADADGDGLPDADERGTGPRCDPPADTDGDGVPDFLDPADPPTTSTSTTTPATEPVPDSDGDGIPDDVDPFPDDAGGVAPVEASRPEPGCGCAVGRIAPGWLAVVPLLARRRRARTPG